jgi:hypothetical protein
LILKKWFTLHKKANMDYDLRTYFRTLKDPRRGQGQRHSLENILTIVIMAILSGYQGLRGFTRFAKSNETDLIELLNLKHGVPTYQTFHHILTSLNESIMVDKFMEWMKLYDPNLSDKYIALDGKAVKSTVTGGNTAAQNFTSIVSAFGHDSNIVYGMQSFQNNKSGEMQSLRDLVEKLGLKDKTYTVDALHTQKKHLT